MKFVFILLLPLCFSQSFVCSAQGCSDAGVCSVGALSLITFRYEILPVEASTLRTIEVEEPLLGGGLQSGKDVVQPGEKDKEQNAVVNGAGKDTLPATTAGTQVTRSFYRYPKYFFQFSTYYGIGDRGTNIITAQLEATAQLIKQKLFAQIKLPYSFISGNLASTSGLADVTFSLSYIAFQKEKSSLILTGGTKIPSNKANLLKDTLPLPMVYQTSLGSTDLLVGAKYKYQKWDVTIGYQHAFNANGNEYRHLSSPATDNGYNTYFESNKMKRADDAIFRINRDFRLKKSIASTGLLCIYHLENDEITNEKGERVKVPGSQGLTLNLNLSGEIPVSKKTGVTFIVAAPAVTRKARPDGLTRKAVVILGFKYSL